jgi:secreted trypsin-like serine protease
MFRRSNAVLVFAVSAIASCTEDPEALDVVHQAVGGGIYDTENEFPHVVQLQIAGFGCTGTLLINRHILTASHCFTDNGDRRSHLRNCLIGATPFRFACAQSLRLFLVVVSQART